jgi:isopropylmalate/homocitrate/citramalate synthase
MSMKNTYVSDWNTSPQATQSYRFAPDLTLCDCTLRDGEQQAGVVFSKDDKVAIAERLDAMGIPEIEAGMPANSQEDSDAIREIVRRCKRARITAVVRALAEEIDFLADCGAWAATLSIPIGGLQRAYKLRWDDDTYIKKTLDIAEYAKKKGLYVTLSPYDTTRADMTFVDRVLREVVVAGTVDRVRVVDTVGAITPEGMRCLARHMKALLGGRVKLEVHCHNDFGLAVATTLAGAQGGAEVLSTTMNGLGERAGNTATEEILAALKFLYGVDLGVDLTRLCEVSRLVEELSGAALQKHKAVVGRHAFSHESGMVVAGVLQMPFVAEAYSPELVGARREILIGKKSGVNSLEHKLAERGLQLTPEGLRAMLREVKALSIEKKRSLTDGEVFAMAELYRKGE